MATTNLSTYDETTIPNANGLRFGIVVSEWNGDITNNLYLGAKETLLKFGVLPEDIIYKQVPGSFELVSGARKFVADSFYGVDAVIVIGSVIQGETKHFDFVCQGTANGIAKLNAEFDTSIIFCVLTDNVKQQAIDRSGGKHGNKGVEAAIAAIKMANF